MSIFIAQLATVVIAHLLAVMSPGPDFVVVSKNSLTYSRKIGIYTALGVAFGISVHVFYSLVGVGLIIAKSVILFNVIKILGAFYLFYLAWKMIRSKPRATQDAVNFLENKKDNLSKLGALKNGFFINVLNPKATLFFLALFTQIISPETPYLWKIIFGAETIIMTFVWFSIVSFLFSNAALKAKLFKMSHIIDRITGVVLIAIGLKVILSNK